MAIFDQNCLFWEFLTYNFQTQLWIFLIFGMELLWTTLILSGNQSYGVLFFKNLACGSNFFKNYSQKLISGNKMLLYRSIFEKWSLKGGFVRWKCFSAVGFFESKFSLMGMFLKPKLVGIKVARISILDCENTWLPSWD